MPLQDLINGPATPESIQASIFGAGQPNPLNVVQRAGNYALPAMLPATWAPLAPGIIGPLGVERRLNQLVTGPRSRATDNPLAHRFGTPGWSAPGPGQSAAEGGMPVPDSVMRTHVNRMPPPKPMTPPSPAVAATEGMGGDAAEALINQRMGITRPEPSGPNGWRIGRPTVGMAPSRLQDMYLNNANARVGRINAANNRWGMPPIADESVGAPVARMNFDDIITKGSSQALPASGRTLQDLIRKMLSQ